MVLIRVIRTFYGLEGLSKGCFLKRSKSGRKLYSFAPYLASVLLNQENYRLHVVHGGLRAFEGRPDNKEADGDTKNYVSCAFESDSNPFVQHTFVSLLTSLLWQRSIAWSRRESIQSLLA